MQKKKREKTKDKSNNRKNSVKKKKLSKANQTRIQIIHLSALTSLQLFLVYEFQMLVSKTRKLKLIWQKKKRQVQVYFDCFMQQQQQWILHQKLEMSNSRAVSVVKSLQLFCLQFTDSISQSANRSTNSTQKTAFKKRNKIYLLVKCLSI